MFGLMQHNKRMMKERAVGQKFFASAQRPAVRPGVTMGGGIAGALFRSLGVFTK